MSATSSEAWRPSGSSSGSRLSDLAWPGRAALARFGLDPVVVSPRLPARVRAPPGELRVALDPVVEAPPTLAPLIDPNLQSCGTIAGAALIYLGIPVAAGFLTRRLLIAARGLVSRALLPHRRAFSDHRRDVPKGGDVVRLPIDALRIAVPLALYFQTQFFLSFWMSRGNIRYRSHVHRPVETASGAVVVRASGDLEIVRRRPRR